MRVVLSQFLHYQIHDRLPYRTDGRGGHTFYGVGSHFLYSSLKDRWYSFAFEAATIDQSDDSVLKQTRIRFNSEDADITPRQSVLDWQSHHRHRSLNDRYSGYRWHQHVNLDVTKPTLITLSVDFKFSDHEEFITAEGKTYLLADLHAGDPPPYYSKLVWYFKKWFGPTL